MHFAFVLHYFCTFFWPECVRRGADASQSSLVCWQAPKKPRSAHLYWLVSSRSSTVRIKYCWFALIQPSFSVSFHYLAWLSLTWVVKITAWNCVCGVLLYHHPCFMKGYFLSLFSEPGAHICVTFCYLCVEFFFLSFICPPTHFSLLLIGSEMVSSSDSILIQCLATCQTIKLPFNWTIFWSYWS